MFARAVVAQFLIVLRQHLVHLQLAILHLQVNGDALGLLQRFDAPTVVIFHGMHLGLLDMGEIDQTRVLSSVNQLQLAVIHLDGIVKPLILNTVECLIKHLVVATQYPGLVILGQLQVVLPDFGNRCQSSLNVSHRQHVGTGHVGVLVVVCLQSHREGPLVVTESRGA